LLLCRWREYGDRFLKVGGVPDKFLEKSLINLGAAFIFRQISFVVAFRKDSHGNRI
jgi:hypothetical protein